MSQPITAMSLESNPRANTLGDPLAVGPRTVLAPVADGGAEGGYAMQILGLAADYDGTLADHGRIDPDTMAALRTLKASGRRLVLVTGRELPELRALCAELDVFDRVVAENGALLFDPATQEERSLAPPPSAALVERLRRHGVAPLSTGRSILATWQPHEATVLAQIRELGLELTVVFNKGAIMVLPPGVNKATGLEAALRELDVSRHAVVAVGDAENDHSLLQWCGHSAAVANATPAVKAVVDTVLVGDHGRGIQELVSRMTATPPTLRATSRHGLLVGRDRGEAAVMLHADGGHVLVLGPTRSGKSTLATTLTERMAEQGYEFCVLDPEGDYCTLRNAISVGTPECPPDAEHLDGLLHRAAANVVVQVRALMPHARLELADSLWAEAVALRARTGRPNWIVVDEAHQTFGRNAAARIPEGMPPTILLTLDPFALTASTLAQIDTVCALGPTPHDVIVDFCRAAGRPPPAAMPDTRPGEILVWRPTSNVAPVAVTPGLPVQGHLRHAGKYADGDVGAAHSFYFRGPHGRINRPARNLFEFLRLADELGDEVWTHHLRAGDYGRWFRQVIRDERLAARADDLMRGALLSAAQTRDAIRREVLARYQPPPT